MAQNNELIYTSAPRGLRPGSSGFCTVAMTAGMPTGLIGPLENLSAYRNQEGDGSSPVNFMHVQMKVAGRPVNILSRIGVAAPDHTGRTNKIAHHVLVSPSGFVAGGPAAVLRQPGFTVDAWDGVVRKIPESKTIPAVDSPPRVAQTWAAQTGDAGWAGYVASIFDSQAPGLPVYLLHRPEQNAVLLEMIDEAIGILPESRRWNATFSTYTGELPPGVTCRLRCVMAGSPEAAARPAAAMTIDLTSSTLGAPPPGRYVDAARAGILTPIESTTASPDSTALELSSVPGTTGIDIDDPYLLAPLAPLPPRGRSAPPPPISSSKRSKTKTRLYVAAAAAFLCLLLGGAAIVYLMRNNSSEMLAESNESAGITVAPASTPTSESVPKEKDPAASKEVASEAVVTTPEAPPTAPMDTDPERNQVEKQSSSAELKQLADQILQDGALFEAGNDQSIGNFKKDTEHALETLRASEKQLKEMQLDDSEISALVRKDDWETSLDELLEGKQKELTGVGSTDQVEELEERLESIQKSLSQLIASEKEWEKVTQDRTDLQKTLPDYEKIKIDAIMSKTRSESDTDLGSDPEGPFLKLRKLSKLLPDQAEKTVQTLRVLASTEIKKQRSLHRLKIYFDGDLNRTHEKLQITPRCYITLDPASMSFDQIKVDGHNPFSFSGSSAAKALPGKYAGWLTIKGNTSGTGVEIQISPQSIGNDIAKQYPLLGQLKILVKQQDNAIDTGKRIYNWFRNNPGVLTGMAGKIEIEIKSKGDEIEQRQTAINSEGDQERKDELNKQLSKVQSDLVSLQSEKGHLNEFASVVGGQASQSSVGSVENLYVTQATKAEDIFKTIDKYLRLTDEDKLPLAPHINSIGKLKDDYQALKRELKIIDLGGVLEFREFSSSGLGQPSLEPPLETFEMFFIPELVYGPPPD